MYILFAGDEPKSIDYGGYAFIATFDLLSDAEAAADAIVNMSPGIRCSSDRDDVIKWAHVLCVETGRVIYEQGN